MATIPSPFAASALASSRAAGDSERAPVWHPATRIAFRFCFVYFGLYAITTQTLQAFIGTPWFSLPDLGILPPLRELFLWIGTHILGLASPKSPPLTGSGDNLFGWMQAFSLLLIAAIGTVIWSVVAHRRTAHPRLFGWLRLFLRIAVGSAFLSYGFAKVIPHQMPTLDLPRLVEPFGNFSPMGVLWSSVGASPVYEIAIGCAEVLGGVLLFFPATTLAGTFICLMDATMVFLLNMTYDVNVKLFSFHLVAMSLFLLAPYARPLFDLFVRHSTGVLRPEPAVGGSASAWHKLVIAQAVFCVYTLGIDLYTGVEEWNKYGAGAPRSPLFGIWDVDSMTVGGATKPALLSDSTRWRRVIFQSPDIVTFQKMDDSFRQYVVRVDSTARSLTLAHLDTTARTLATATDTTKPRSVLTYRRLDNEHLFIDGSMDAQDVHLALAFRDPDAFLQRRRGFHWVSEEPFDR